MKVARSKRVKKILDAIVVVLLFQYFVFDRRVLKVEMLRMFLLSARSGESCFYITAEKYRTPLLSNVVIYTPAYKQYDSYLKSVLSERATGGKIPWAAVGRVFQ